MEKICPLGILDSFLAHIGSLVVEQGGKQIHMASFGIVCWLYNGDRVSVSGKTKNETSV